MSFEQLSSILMAALGISFLIFIHELGHFVAARVFKVRVDTFSLGFGPRIFGFRRGETDYRISAIPLGGYVKMAGEYGDYDDAAEPAPDDLMAKPAWQRLIVFSAGVLVNFGFAFLVFPLAFTLGVPFTAPVIGAVTPGGAAWAAGLRPGDEVLAVNGARIYGFSDIALEIALGDPEDTHLVIRRGGAERNVRLSPTRNSEEGRYEIGISPGLDTAVVVTDASSAADAGLSTGDRLLSINGATINQVNPPITVVLEEAVMRGRDIDIRFQHDGVTREASIKARQTEQSGPHRLGVLPITTAVLGLRGRAGSATFPLRVGDIVETVDGQTVLTATVVMTAIRSAPPGPVTMTVRRGGATQTVTLPAELRDAFAEGDIALSNDLDGTRVQVLPGEPLAEAGLVDGDWLLAVDDQPLSSYRELQDRVRDASRPLAIRYRRAADSTTHRVNVQPRPSTNWDYGFNLAYLEVRHKEGLSGAMRAGFDTSINVLRTTWLTLTKLFTGQVATKNLGGIVSISVLSYHFAGSGVAKLLFFLGMLSINLGFINILPIPVLDGGQVMFLAFEKIKGSRLSDRFMNSMQLAGLVAILALVLYVTYNDILRLVR